MESHPSIQTEATSWRWALRNHVRTFAPPQCSTPSRCDRVNLTKMGCVTIDPTDADYDCDSLSSKDAEDKENVFECKSWKLRALWFLVALTIFGILITFGGALILRFNAEDVRVVSRIKVNQSPFPLVTFCNMNPYKSSMVEKIPHLARLIKRFDERARMANKRKGAAEQQRVKREAASFQIADHYCICDYTNVHNMIESSDDMRVWVAKPRGTNWTCGFECCVIKWTKALTRYAPPRLDRDEIALLRRAGMMIYDQQHEDEKDRAMEGEYCSDWGESCFGREANGSNNIVGKPCEICKQHQRKNFDGNISVIYSCRTDVYYIGVIREGNPDGPFCRLGVEVGKSASDVRSPSSTCSASTNNGTNGSSSVEDSNSSILASMVNGTNRTSIEEDDDDPTHRAIDNILAEAKLNELAMNTNLYDMIPYIMVAEAIDIKIGAGYSSEDLFLDGKRCTYSNFTINPDPYYGNCYSFDVEASLTSSRRSGAASGLTISTSPGLNEYLSFIENAGFRVSISEHGKPVFPDAAGFSVLSGSRTSISLKAACLRSCYQQRVIEQCNCGDPRIPLPSANISTCELANRSCVNDNYDNMGGMICQCPLECSLDQYDAVLTNVQTISQLQRQSHEDVRHDGDRCVFGNINNHRVPGKIGLHVIHVVVGLLQYCSHIYWLFVHDRVRCVRRDSSMDTGNVSEADGSRTSVVIREGVILALRTPSNAHFV